MSGLKPIQFGGVGGTSGGKWHVYLPKDDILLAWGVKQSEINELNKLYPKGANGLREITDPLTFASSTQGIPTSYESMYSALLALPKVGGQHSVFDTVMRQWNIPVSGSMKTSQLDAILRSAWTGLQSASGHLGNPTMQAVAALTGVVKTELTQLNDFYGNTNYAAKVNATQSSMYTAEANADNLLQTWGIDTPAMNSLVVQLATQHGITNTNEIMDIIRQQPAYKAAFPGLSEYNADPHAIHMTEGQYMTYSQSILDSATQYGVPRSFINQQEIGTLLRGHVSAPEFQQRVQDVFTAVQNADAGTKAILASKGIGPGELMTFWANPGKALPQLQRLVASAEIQDYGNRVGLKGLTGQGADQLAQMAKLSATQGNNTLGVGVQNIESSLLGASRDSALLSSLPGSGQPSLDTKQLIGSQIAGFGGTTQDVAQTQVARAEQARAAPFEKGGGYAEDAKGVAIGAARI